MAVRLRVIEAFRDAEAGVFRVQGDVFEASDERARVILGAGVAEVVEVVPDPAPEPAEQPGQAEPERRGRKRG